MQPPQQCLYVFAAAFALVKSTTLVAAAPILVVSSINTTHQFLIANGLASATVALTGFNNGERILGIKGTPDVPWKIEIFNPTGAGFFNIPSYTEGDYFWDGEQAFAGSFAAAPISGAQFDTGILSGWLFNSTLNPPPPADCDLIGRFAAYSIGGNDIRTSMSWMYPNPDGVPVAGTIPFLRLTAPSNSTIRASFVVVMHTPPAEYPVSLMVSFAGIEGFAPCCTPTYQCNFTYPWTCQSLGGQYYANCPNCQPCLSDIDGDADVGVSDLLEVIRHWGGCPCYPQPCVGNITADYKVGVADLLKVITDWGPCPK